MADTALLQALDAFEAQQKQAAVASLDVCQIYKSVKPILTELLPLINLIPVVGPRIVSAIKVLMAGLDAFCPAAVASPAQRT